MGRIQIFPDARDPGQGNTLVPDTNPPYTRRNPGALLTLRVHKNSRKRGPTSAPVVIRYPPEFWEEILRARDLVPDEYRNTYLLACARPPIKSQQITEATNAYLRVPESQREAGLNRVAYTNRDLRQSYAAAHRELAPGQMVHTSRTHVLDYLPPEHLGGGTEVRDL